MKYANCVEDVVESVASAGLGDVTLAGTPPALRVTIPSSWEVGDQFPYRIEQGVTWEQGIATLTATSAFSREPTDSSAGGGAVAFSGGARFFHDVDAATTAAFLTAADGVAFDDYLEAHPGSTVGPTDVIAMLQGSETVGVSALDFAVFANSKWTSATETNLTIATTTPFPLDFSTHNRRRLVCTAAANIAGPSSFASVGNGFGCKVTNVSGDIVTFGIGISCIPSGTTLANGQTAELFASGGTLYAQMPVAAASSDGVAPGQVTDLAAGTSTATTQPLTWTAPTTGDTPFTYTVQYRETGGSTWNTATTGLSSASYTVTGLTASTSYDYQVIASNTTGNGTASDIVTNSTDASGGSAPFTATARSDFPISIHTFNGTNFYWHDIVPTGSPTIVSVEFALTEAATVYPAGTIDGTTTPRGTKATSTNYGGGASWLVNSDGSDAFSVNFSVPSATDFYFWIKVTDSDSAVWYFRRTSPISIGDNVTQENTSATSDTPAYP